MRSLVRTTDHVALYMSPWPTCILHFTKNLFKRDVKIPAPCNLQSLLVFVPPTFSTSSSHISVSPVDMTIHRIWRSRGRHALTNRPAVGYQASPVLALSCMNLDQGPDPATHETAAPCLDLAPSSMPQNPLHSGAVGRYATRVATRDGVQQ
jgi:hypothetical protein